MGTERLISKPELEKSGTLLLTTILLGTSIAAWAGTACPEPYSPKHNRGCDTIGAEGPEDEPYCDDDTTTGGCQAPGVSAYYCSTYSGTFTQNIYSKGGCAPNGIGNYTVIGTVSAPAAYGYNNDQPCNYGA